MAKMLAGSRNVAWAPFEEITGGALEVGKTTYNLFRALTLGDKRGALCLRVPASDLTESDIAKINLICDKHEGMKNRNTKVAISQALCRTFNGIAIELYDLGCGERPIANYIPSNMDIDFTGIDIDPSNVASLREQGHRAYDDWQEAIDARGSTNTPRIATAVYSLHMMVSEDSVDNFSKFINEEGFLVGNFYIDPREEKAYEQRNKLHELLGKTDLAYTRVQDSKHNEYWVIYKPEAKNVVERFTPNLEQSIKANKPTGP